MFVKSAYEYVICTTTLYAIRTVPMDPSTGIANTTCEREKRLQRPKTWRRRVGKSTDNVSVRWEGEWKTKNQRVKGD